VKQPRSNPLARIRQNPLEDETCQALLLEYETANQRLVELLPLMPPEQRDAVMDYIGVLGELHRRGVALALESGE